MSQLRTAWLMVGLLGSCSPKANRNENSAGENVGEPVANVREAGANATEQCHLIDDGPGRAGQVPIRVEIVARGLEVPWGLAFLPDGSLLVTERRGRLRRIGSAGLEAEPVAELDIEARGEGGFLGIALHPAFSDNRRFFVYVTRGRVNRLEQWRLDEHGRRAELERVVLDSIPAARYHDGGRLRIGPDKKLYVGTGDAGKPETSQDRANVAGKLLRLDLDGGIPPDNPWPTSPVYITGIRNTQGFDWIDDALLVVTDHGPSGELGRSGHDEVSVAPAGSNLGWPVIYGCERRTGMITPSLTWRSAVPPGGAAFYTGDSIPAWRNSLLIGVLGAKHLHRVVFDLENPRSVVDHEIYLSGDPPAGHGRLREVIQGPDGALYVTTSNCDGRGACPADKDLVLRLYGGPEGPGRAEPSPPSPRPTGHSPP